MTTLSSDSSDKSLAVKIQKQKNQLPNKFITLRIFTQKKISRSSESVLQYETACVLPDSVGSTTWSKIVHKSHESTNFRQSSAIKKLDSIDQSTWLSKNERRVALIEKEFNGGLTKAEIRELKILEGYVSYFLDQIAPLPKKK